MDQAISEICHRAKISDYLRSVGIQLIKSGKRLRCCCPIPGHKDDTPSFYISTMPSGIEVFKCFGCGEGGSIISLMALREGVKKGSIVKRLSTTTGVALGKTDFSAKTEPHADQVLTAFCDEDVLVGEIATIALPFLWSHCTPDAINKISRLYEMIDQMADRGDGTGMQEWSDKLSKVIMAYDI